MTFWEWMQERRGRNLEPAAIPSVESFTTPDIYSTRPTDMPGNLTFNPWLTQKGGYDIAAHEKAKERWAFKEDLRLKQRARLAKLANMKQNLAPGGKYGQDIAMVEGLPAAGVAPLDVLDSSVKTMADFEAKRKNMFRYEGLT